MTDKEMKRYEIKRSRRAKGIEDLIESVEEIHWIQDEVQKYDENSQQYFYQKKNRLFDALQTKFIPLTINKRYESNNCAHEYLLQYQKMKDDKEGMNKLRALMTAYKIYKFYKK